MIVGTVLEQLSIIEQDFLDVVRWRVMWLDPLALQMLLEGVPVRDEAVTLVVRALLALEWQVHKIDILHLK